MASKLSQVIEKGLSRAEALADNPTFTWDDTEYICNVGSWIQNVALEYGGFAETLTSGLIVRKSLFTGEVFPEATQTITYKDTAHEIQSVTTDPTDTFLQIALVKNK